MTRDQRIPWLRIGAESLAIVASILLAFAIDAWWDERGRRAQEEALLAGLLDDLRDDYGDYDEFQSTYLNHVIAANYLLVLIEDPAGRDEEYQHAKQAGMTSGEAFEILGAPSGLETVLVTYDQMTSMGASNVLSDSALWRRIGRYYALARDRSDVNISTLSLTQAYRGLLQLSGWIPQDSDRIPAAEVMADRRLRAQVLFMRENAENRVRIAKEMKAAASDLIGEIESRID